MLTQYIQHIQIGRDLDESMSEDALSRIFSGTESEDDIGNILVALAEKGESVSEIVGFANAMRANMTRIEIPGDSLDVCGTGGSGKERFNISTASALVLAACGVGVVKHGNYGSKQPNGSFDFLESLDIPFYSDPLEVASQFQVHNVCFIFARYFHPAMKVVGPIRQKLGRRTIFNILGPLCNPAKNTHHVMGTTTLETAEKLAQALQRLGITRALVVAGGDGLDELSPVGDNTVLDVTQSGISKSTVAGSELDVDVSGYPVGNADQNAAFFTSIILSQKPHALIDHIAINAGLGLLCMNKVDSLQDGIQTARDAMLSDAVTNTLLGLQGKD
jgi:anthranilate phosphoribosyltransferase